jgi:hypothetical protein
MALSVLVATATQKVARSISISIERSTVVVGIRRLHEHDRVETADRDGAKPRCR